MPLLPSLCSPMPLAVGSLLLLLAAVLWMRLPIALLLAGLGVLGVGLLDGAFSARTLLGNELWGNFSSYGLTVIPLFIFMGQICFYAGLNERLYRALYTLVGHLPGGLAVATLLACGGFAAICGSNTATAATMSGVALPEMRRYGYNQSLSAGTVAVGATLGVIIPPSVVLIVIGLQTGLSISTLFLASIIPGILLMLAFTLCAFIVARRHPEWAPRRPRASLRERLHALPELSEVVILWGGVLGGMGCGLVTPTEAGGLGSLLALLIGLLTRRIGMKGILNAVCDTLRLTAMILLLVAGAMIYGKFLALTRLPFELAEMVATLHVDPLLVLLLILIIYFIGGMLMDALALLLITVPIFFPLMQGLGTDLVWFSIIVTVVTTMGAVTPPVGVCAYVVASSSLDIPLPSIFRGIVHYIPAYIGILVLLTLLPGLTTFIPSMVATR